MGALSILILSVALLVVVLSGASSADWSSINIDVFVGSIIAAVTALSSVIAALIASTNNKKREIEARLFPEKSKVYHRFFKMYEELLFHQKGWGEVVPDEDISKKKDFVTRVMAIKTDMQVWASGRTIKALVEAEEVGLRYADHPNLGVKMFEAYGKVYASMRRELGHGHDMTPLEIVSVYLTPEARAELFPKKYARIYKSAAGIDDVKGQ